MSRTLFAFATFAFLSWAATSGAAPCAEFTDVDSTSSFCASVTWMKNQNVTLGCTATQYCPNDPTSRLQMAAFMNRLASNAVFQRAGNAWGETAVLGTKDAQAVEVIAGGSRVMRYHTNSAGPSTSPNLLGGHPDNTVGALHIGQTVAGGGSDGDDCFNPLTGTNNRSCANHATFSFATVSGGIGNLAVGGTVAGGELNTASGLGSFVAGGSRNIASGANSVAMGVGAVVNGTGSFLFADASNINSQVISSTPNEFAVAATGGIALGTTRTFSNVCRLAPGGGSWSCTSDRAVKRDFAKVDNDAVLAKVLLLPVSTWRFKTQPEDVRHMGPMAQDFREAFGLGIDDKTITQVDVNGVTLAAIQGLNRKLETERAARVAEIAALRAEVAELRIVRKELAAIRAMLAPAQTASSTR